MTIYIRMTGESAEDELRSLHDWLLDEPDVRRNAEVTLRSSTARPGEMGGVLDAIQVVIDDGVALSGLVISYLTWRGTRSKKNTVTIERGDTKVTLTDTTAETAESIVKALESETP
ncbi:hypothetical protein [Spirillospora sp. NPDC047279]|uniref:effector-associated constant component EACC1 n=1 Tax=Spirillospora sp. NPDC047279 TaxID=3155478 RepID=UPI00340CC0E1